MAGALRASGERWLTLLASRPEPDGAPIDAVASADTAHQPLPLSLHTEGLTGASRECYNRAAPISPEVRMRPYRLVDEALDDDEEEHPRVVPIGANGRSRAAPFSLGTRPRPWTPRETVVPAVPSRAAPSPLAAPGTGLTRTHQLMIASFVIICVGMILGMVLVRVWDEASRAVAALPPEGSPVQSRVTSASAPTGAPSAPAEPVEAAPPQAAGAVTTEIRVLQPNYTVAPGDSLGIIARRHGTNVDALASINNLENRNSLSVGQKLIIP